MNTIRPYILIFLCTVFSYSLSAMASLFLFSTDFYKRSTLINADRIEAVLGLSEEEEASQKLPSGQSDSV